MIDTNTRNRTMLRVAVTNTTLQQPTLGQRRTVRDSSWHKREQRKAVAVQGGRVDTIHLGTGQVL